MYRVLAARFTFELVAAMDPSEIDRSCVPLAPREVLPRRPLHLIETALAGTKRPARAVFLASPTGGRGRAHSLAKLREPSHNTTPVAVPVAREPPRSSVARCVFGSLGPTDLIRQASTATIRSMSTLRLLAPAKINLCLSVGAPLPAGSTDRFDERGERDTSGYHPIASWFAPIALFDQVKVERLSEGHSAETDGDGTERSFEVVWAKEGGESHPVEWPLDRDLAVRAHGLMERVTGRHLPVKVRVRKRIPAGGGLAGGSSDAAALMMALTALFELEHDAARLREWSMWLGSDLAFFMDEPVLEAMRAAAQSQAGKGRMQRDRAAALIRLVPRSAVVAGLGERVERVKSLAAKALLCLPPFGCPTGAVYQAFDRVSMQAQPDQARVSAAIESSNASGQINTEALFNDLLPAARVAVPQFGPLMDHLTAAVKKADLARDGGVQMSGSGSTLFVLDAEHESETRIIAAAASLGCATVRTECLTERSIQ